MTRGQIAACLVPVLVSCVVTTWAESASPPGEPLNEVSQINELSAMRMLLTQKDTSEK